MQKKVLVTGGCGFIGSNIVKKLLEKDYYVKIIDDLSSGSLENISLCLESGNCTFVKGSITDLAFLKKEFSEMDVIIHEAANPDVRASRNQLFEDFTINVKGTLNVLQAMVENDIPKIVFASSGGTVYGESEVIPTPEQQPFAPISHYGASKAACEQYLSSFASLHKIEAISLRLGNIFGPPSDHGVMYDFFWKLKKNPNKLEILGNGLQVKAYLYVDDCVDAHILAMDTKVAGHSAFNIASPKGATVNAVADALVESMGLKEVSYTYTGGERGWEGDVRKAVVDISKAEKKLAWKPKVSLKEGIKKYVDWLSA